MGKQTAKNSKAALGATFFEAIECDSQSKQFTMNIGDTMKNLRHYPPGPDPEEGFWNDRISSIKIEEGAKIIVYKHILKQNSGGTHETFYFDDNDSLRNLWNYKNGKWHREISAIRVLDDS